MKILFLTVENPTLQGDYLEVSTLHGMRQILGDNCIDLPRKKVMYHDWSETSKNTLHGKGFTLLNRRIDDIQSRDTLQGIDFIIHGVTDIYGIVPTNKYDHLVDNDPKRIWFLDGHDLYGHANRHVDYLGEKIIGVQRRYSFKRELIEENLPDVFPTGFGIPEHMIQPSDCYTKSQWFQKTAPPHALFQTGPSKHVFTDEREYYNDMKNSWFGLSCKKGGWDCLRHYEIIASGSLLMFRDFDQKPKTCSPQDLPAISYSSPEEARGIMERLVRNNRPTDEYINILLKQKQWLMQHGTTRARARKILDILETYKGS